MYVLAVFSENVIFGVQAAGIVTRGQTRYVEMFIWSLPIKCCWNKMLF